MSTIATAGGRHGRADTAPPLAWWFSWTASPPPRGWWILLAALALASCVRTPVVARAITARGRSSRALVRWIDADVRAGVPGKWQWRKAFLAPDRFSLTIVTADEPHHYLFDGTLARSFIGDHLVATEGPTTPLASQARFEALVQLDLLRLPGVRLTPLGREAVPPDVTTGLAMALPEDGARYRLGFDDQALLVWAAGPLDFSPFARGDVEVRFSDFRRVDGVMLPFRITYGIAGTSFLEERVLRACVDDPGLVPASFETPANLPMCDGP